MCVPSFHQSGSVRPVCSYGTQMTTRSKCPPCIRFLSFCSSGGGSRCFQSLAVQAWVFRKRLLHQILAVIAATTIISSTAIADIIGVMGDAVLIDHRIPGDVDDFRLGQNRSNSRIKVFHEQQDRPFDAAIGVNARAAGTYVHDIDAVSASTLMVDPASYATYSSCYLHADVNENAEPFPTRSAYTATVAFDENILGVIVLGADFADPMGRFQRSDVTYPLNPYGLEFLIGNEMDGDRRNNDEFEISSDRRSLTVSFETTNSIDRVRVITAVSSSIPEPGSLLVVAGMMGAGLLARRRTRHRGST